MPDLIDPIIEVQDTLDEWLEDNPEAQQYITKIYYLPEHTAIPDDVTHVNRLTSRTRPELEIRLGVVATAETAAVANVILGILERVAAQADPKPGA